MSEELKTPTNWPNPERPGVPLFPERDGWHWVATTGDFVRPLYWDARHASWQANADPYAPPWKYTRSWKYHGPCFTPTQIAEMLAGERERICDTISKSMDSSCSLLPEAGKTFLKAACEDITDNIRNLGAAP